MSKGIGDLMRHYRVSENLTETAQDARRLAEYAYEVEKANADLHNTNRTLKQTIEKHLKVVADKQSRILQMDGEIARLQSRLDKSGVSM